LLCLLPCLCTLPPEPHLRGTVLPLLSCSSGSRDWVTVALGYPVHCCSSSLMAGQFSGEAAGFCHTDDFIRCPYLGAVTQKSLIRSLPRPEIWIRLQGKNFSLGYGGIREGILVAHIFLFCFVFWFWRYWGLNSGPHAC
jgi:hypothetical protein